jgi:hypothetical protein
MHNDPIASTSKGHVNATLVVHTRLDSISVSLLLSSGFEATHL